MNRSENAYERDVNVVRMGIWLSNMALLFAILAIAPAFLYIFASVLIYVFGFIIYILANIAVTVVTLGLVLLGGFPPIPWDTFFGGFSTDQILGSISSILTVYLPVMSVISFAVAILAILICKRKAGIAGSKGGVSRGIASIVIVALSVVLTFIALMVGGGV